jgi:hypothetical protein
MTEDGVKVVGVVERAFFGYSQQLKGIYLTVEVDTYLHGMFTFNYTCEKAKEMLEYYNISDIVLLEGTPVILEWKDGKYRLLEVIRGRRIS